MSLLTLRKQLIKLSGRYDLVKDTVDYKDDGANWYINKGQRMLDLHPETPDIFGRVFDRIDANGFYITMERCRAIHEVWVNNTTGRSKLEKRNLAWLRTQYSEVASSTTSGTPLYYAPSKHRGIDITDMNELGTFLNLVLNETSADTVQGLLIFPPGDEKLVVEVVGKFFSPTLSADDDTSFWDANYDNVLLLAALYQLEVFYRNTEGAKDWMAALIQELRSINFTSIEEEIAEIDQMEG